MTSQSRSSWACAAIAAGVAACWPWQVGAQEPDPTPPPDSAVVRPAEDQQGGETEVGDVEEYLLTPVTIADLLGDGPPRPFRFGGRVEHQFSANIDDAEEFSVTRATGAAGMLFPLGQRTGGAVGAAYTYACYDFDDAAAFGGQEAWGDVQGIHAFAIFKHLLNRNWSVICGGLASSSGEPGADTSSTITGGGFVGGGYRASGDLYVQLGVNVSSQLEDDPSILPIFRLNWQIDDKWLFRAGVVETGATDSVGAGVTYRFDDHWSVHGRVGYVNRRFRLDDSGFAPEGIGQERQYRGAVSVTWEPNRDTQIGLIGGVAFGGDLVVEDEDGDRLFRENYDAVPFLSARLAWRF